MLRRPLLEKSLSRLKIGLKKMADESNKGSMLKGFVKFDRESSKTSVVHMIVIDKLPFRFVQSQGLQAY